MPEQDQSENENRVTDNPSNFAIINSLMKGYVKNIGVPLATAPYHAVEKLMSHGYTPGQQDEEGAKNAAAVATMLMGVGGTRAGGKPQVPNETELGMFGGKTAKTANLDALQVAKKLEAQGAPIEEVIKQTGWGRGADGQWRFEIMGGDQSKLHGIDRRGFPNKQYLSDMWEFPQLYEAYPELKNVRIKGGMPPSHGAYYKPLHLKDDPTIALHEGDFTKPTLLNKWTGSVDHDTLKLRDSLNKQLLGHEGQHILQDIEGFNPGFNPDILKESAELQHKYRDLLNSTAEPLVKHLMKPDNTYQKPLPKDLATIIAKNNATREVGRDIYKRNMGEVEAENAARRIEYTDQQRLEKPWNTTEKVHRSKQLNDDLNITVQRLNSGKDKIPSPTEGSTTLFANKPNPTTSALISWLKSQKPVDEAWVTNWAKEAGVPIKDIRGQDTKYMRLEPDSPVRPGEKHPTVRLPQDAERHIGTKLTNPEIGNLFDTGTGPRLSSGKAIEDKHLRQIEPSIVNQSGMSYANPEALDAALKWRLHKAPNEGNWLIPEEMAPKLPTKKAPAEPMPEPPNSDQLKLFANRPTPMTAALVSILEKSRGEANILKPKNAPMSYGDSSDLARIISTIPKQKQGMNVIPNVGKPNNVNMMSLTNNISKPLESKFNRLNSEEWKHNIPRNSNYPLSEMDKKIQQLGHNPFTMSIEEKIKLLY